MTKFKKAVSLALIVVEGLLTVLPFLIAWWGSALYRSILAGWAVSGMQAAEKRAALAKLMGDDDHAV
jgi:hypothetical protein